MNKKILLLLASSVISAGIIANGNCVNAKLNVYPSNGAIMEQSMPDFNKEIKEIMNSKTPSVSKLLDGVALYGDNGNFTVADQYFAGLYEALYALKQSDKMQFDRYIKICADKFLDMSDNNPTSAAAKYYLFKIMQLSENYDLAFQAIRKCITLDSNSPVYQFELANLYSETNQYVKAIKIYNKLIAYYPREEEFRLALADAYEKKGMYKEAVKEYRVAAAFVPEDDCIVTNLVQAKIDEKQSRDLFNDYAKRILENLDITTETYHPYVKDGAGTVISLKQNETIVPTEVLTAENTETVNAQQNVSKEVLMENNQSSDGKYYIYGQKVVTNTEKFTFAPGTSNNNVVVSNSQNLALQNMTETKPEKNIFEQNDKKSEVLVSDKAVKETKKKNSIFKKNKAETQPVSSNQELYIKANELMAQEEYQQVIDLLSKINPPTLRSLTTIASCYNSLGNSELALEYYKNAEKMAPDNAQILYSIAYMYYSLNDVENAKRYLERSLTIDPENSEAVKLNTYILQQDSNDVLNNAVSYLNSGNYTESKKILDELVKKDSTNFQAYYYLGHISYATKKYADAVQEFLKAIKLSPEYALSYYSLGLAYDKLQKFSDSLASYEKFVQMTSDDNKYTQYAKSRINTIKSRK